MRPTLSPPTEPACLLVINYAIDEIPGDERNQDQNHHLYVLQLDTVHQDLDYFTLCVTRAYPPLIILSSRLRLLDDLYSSSGPRGYKLRQLVCYRIGCGQP